MVTLRCPFYLESARPEPMRDLVVLSQALPPPSLGTAAMSARWLSLLCEGVVRVFATVCALAGVPEVGTRYEQNVG